MDTGTALSALKGTLHLLGCNRRRRPAAQFRFSKAIG